MRISDWSSDVCSSDLLKGEISRSASPSIDIDFGFEKATLFHQEYKTRIENATLEGSFASSDVDDLAKARLSLKNISGKLNSENFTANFVLANFKDPDIVLDFKVVRSEEHTSELQSLMRITYAVLFYKKKKTSI